MFSGCTFTGNISLSDVDVARRGSETGTTTTTSTTQTLDYKKILATADRLKMKPYRPTEKDRDAFKNGLEFAKKNRTSIVAHSNLYYSSGVLRKHDEFLAANPKAATAREELIHLLATTWAITGKSFLAYECERTIERQRELVKKGASKTMNSMHLKKQACDFAPWDEREPNKLAWGDTAKYSFIHGVNTGAWEAIAHINGYSGRYQSGQDWDSDGKFKDQSFHDLAHAAIRFIMKGYKRVIPRI